MGLGKKLLKTTPAGYVAIKAHERRQDPEYQAEKAAQREAKEAAEKVDAEQKDAKRGSGSGSELGAKGVAKRLGVAWPPANGWHGYKASTTGKFKDIIVLLTEDEIVLGNTRLPLATARAVLDGSTVTIQGLDQDMVLPMRSKDNPQLLVDKINSLASPNDDPELEARRTARMYARKEQAAKVAAIAAERKLVAKFAPGLISIKLYANGDIEYSWGNQTGNVTGATARVDQSGSERIFRDTRQAYITIEGPYVSISQKLASEGKMTVQSARQFCARVNQLSQQLATKQQPTQPAAHQPPPAGQVDIPDQIRKLSQLKDQGILTDEEFSTKKAELLAKL